MDLGTVWKGECRVLGTGGNAPGARTVKGPGAEKGALPRDPQAPVVALAELLHSSYICQRTPCWASPVQE